MAVGVVVRFVELGGGCVEWMMELLDRLPLKE